MANKGRVMNVGATKRGRPWSEKKETPTKFRSGVAGPHCRCCGKMYGRKLAVKKRMRRQIIRRREKIELRKEANGNGE